MLSCFQRPVLLLVVLLKLESTLALSPTNETLHCRLSLHSRFHDNHSGPSDTITCQPIVNNTVTPYSYSFASIENTATRELLEAARPKLRRGESVYLALHEAHVHQGRLLSHSQATLHDSSSPIPHRRLSLPEPIGTRSALVLRIVATDAAPTPSRDELHYYLFDASISLQSQLLACSSGQLSIVPTSLGVIDVVVPMASKGANYQDLVNAAYDAGVLQVRSQAAGYSSLTDLRDAADLLLFVLPPNTVSYEGSTSEAQWDWAAYGAIPGQQSVFNDAWITYLACPAHELMHK